METAIPIEQSSSSFAETPSEDGHVSNFVYEQPQGKRETRLIEFRSICRSAQMLCMQDHVLIAALRWHTCRMTQAQKAAESTSAQKNQGRCASQASSQGERPLTDLFAPHFLTAFSFAHEPSHAQPASCTSAPHHTTAEFPTSAELRSF